MTLKTFLSMALFFWENMNGGSFFLRLITSSPVTKNE